MWVVAACSATAAAAVWVVTSQIQIRRSVLPLFLSERSAAGPVCVHCS